MIIHSTFQRLSTARAVKRTLACLTLPLVLVACGSDSDDDKASIRVIHASPDAPKVNVLLDNDSAIEGLDYSKSSGFLTVDADSYDVVVNGITPSGDAEVINVPGLELKKDSRTTIVAIDNVASIEPLVVADSAAKPSGSEVALRVVHASPAAPAVDVYVTAPGDDIAAIEPALSFAFKESVDAGALAAGEVQIQVTPAGTKTVVYDSGTVDLSGFAGQQLVLLAVDTTNDTRSLASPVKLIAVNNSQSLELLDIETQAGVKVVHGSSDAGVAAGGPVEVFATSDALGVDPVELIDGFSYTDIVPALDSPVVVPAATDYVFDVAPDTDMIGDSVFTSEALTLVKGSEYTVIAAGLVASTPAFSLLPTEDFNRAIVTQASVKVIHGAPSAGLVDVYVTAAGEVASTDLSSVTPVLTDFEFGSITDYLTLLPGDYDIRVVAGGNVAINVEGLTLAGGTVATAIAREPAAAGEPTDFGLILLTN